MTQPYATETLTPLPTQRSTPFDPPPALRDPAWLGPVRPILMAGDRRGWLVTGYEEARQVLADPRFSADRAKADSPIRARRPEDRRETPPGMFISQDPPDHTRYRKQLTGLFTVRRMRALAGRIEEYVDERLDAMEALGAPADLVAEFAMPVPSLVICELLGVDYADRGRFQEWTAKLLSLETPVEEAGELWQRLDDFMRNLVRHKRRHPADDILGGLIDSDTAFTDEELANIGKLLLIAGHETTANMIGLSTFALLQHQDQLDRLRRDPDLIPGAVEELLRYLTIVQFVAVRVALEDVELGGHVIPAGETVAMHLPEANRDPDQFADPDTLDVTRERVRHVAFGHGIHQCLGQQLARTELVVGLGKLLTRFPGLRLAVDPSQVPLRHDMVIYGVHRLPVAW
ncbi:cytochrome P450 [Microlunatus parietis]|uniref:Cytochrome P450 n=1 Tax=Microlunatus parietis TaxID=682979 RepID=A0A7Y9I2R7_9ACTN|nr:cytochrome P450 [Microlunatus parietis]NYE69172.1 cytochrome P450 [Microlunatus parietis]